MSCNFLAPILIDPPVAHPPGSVTTSSQAAAGQSWGERLQQSGLGGPNPPPPPHPHHHPHHHHHQQQQQHDQDCSSSPGNLLLARHPTITPTPYQNSTEKLVPTLPLALGFSTYSGPFSRPMSPTPSTRKDHCPRLNSGPGSGSRATSASGNCSRLTPPGAPSPMIKIINFL